MEQMFMIEVLVKKIELKFDPPEKDEYELQLEAEEKRQAELLAKKLAKKKKKKKKIKKKRKKKNKKNKIKSLPIRDEEIKYMKTCTITAQCLPLFDFFVAHDNFIPPPPVPKGKKKKKKGKKKKAKINKKKKGKKKKKQKPSARKINLPSEILPHPPFYGVGNSVIFISRPSTLKELMKKKPLCISAWNRNDNPNFVAACKIDWHEPFFECLQNAEELNPADKSKGEFRNTIKPQQLSVTVEIVKKLNHETTCATRPCGEIELFLKLQCLGNAIQSNIVTLPQIGPRIPCRHYVSDDQNTQEFEVHGNWANSALEKAPPVAFFYGAPNIPCQPEKKEEEVHACEDYEASFTNSELVIMSMGFPKGPCGGVNCPKRLDYRGSQYSFVLSCDINGEFHKGLFVKKRDVHGPCGRLNCPLAIKARAYLAQSGAYKKCKEPCPRGYYDIS